MKRLIATLILIGSASFAASNPPIIRPNPSTCTPEFPAPIVEQPQPAPRFILKWRYLHFYVNFMF